MIEIKFTREQQVKMNELTDEQREQLANIFVGLVACSFRLSKSLWNDKIHVNISDISKTYRDKYVNDGDYPMLWTAWHKKELDIVIDYVRKV